MRLSIEVFDSLPQDACDIRTEVFVDEQGFREEFDTDDGKAVHLVGYLNSDAVATCRILPMPDSYLIGRVAVKKVFRGFGFGSQMINAAEQEITKKGGGTVYIHSQEQASVFYQKLGYIPTGECDFEEGCPHIMLFKNI